MAHKGGEEKGQKEPETEKGQQARTKVRNREKEGEKMARTGKEENQTDGREDHGTEGNNLDSTRRKRKVRRNTGW